MSTAVRAPSSRNTVASALLPYLIPLCIALLFTAIAEGAEDRVVLVLAALFTPLLIGTILARPIVGVILMIANFLFVYSKWIPVTGLITPNNALGFLALLGLFYGLYKERDFWFLKNPAFLLLALITVLYTVSTILGKQFVPMIPTGRGLKWQDQGDLPKLITRMAFFLFFIYFVRTKRQILSVIVVILFFLYMAVPASFFMVFSGAGWGGYRARAGFLVHSAGNPNRLAFLCLFATTLVWHYVVAHPRAGVRWVAVPGMVGLVLAAIASGSRSGFLNLMIMGAVLVWQGKGVRLRRAVTGVAVLVMTVLLAGELIPERAITRATAAFVDTESDTGYRSTAKRLGTVVLGAQILAQHPFLGVGIGNFLAHHQALNPGGFAGAAHNSYLQALTEGGILTFFSYLGLFTWCMMALLKLERGYLAGLYGRTDLLWLIRGLRATWVLFLSFSIFADVWLHVLFYVMVGTTVSLRRLHGWREELLFHAVPVAPAYGRVGAGYGRRAPG